MTKGGHIFISHGSENRDQANELARFLEGRGAQAWIAPRNVRPGMDYSEQLQLAIEECAAFVVLVTEDSNKSPYVRVETEMAFSINKPIFPVRVADVKPAAGLALFLKIKHWTDAYGTEREANLERLVRELQVLGAVTEPTPSSSAPASHPAGEPAQAAAAPPAASDTPPPPPPPPAPRPGASSWPAYSAPTAWASSPTPPPAAGTVSASPGAGAAAPGGDEARRALIGPNADHYISSWNRMDATQSIRGFNIAGLLGNFLWLAYRKMWIPLAAGLGVILVAELIAGFGTGGRIAGWLLIVAFCVALGLFGDHVYRLHLRRVAAAGGDTEQLRARGGVSMIGPAVLVGLAILAGIVGTVALNRQSAAPADTGSTKAREERGTEGADKSGDQQEERSTRTEEEAR